jgi:hypothetical protein
MLSLCSADTSHVRILIDDLEWHPDRIVPGNQQRHADHGRDPQCADERLHRNAGCNVDRGKMPGKSQDYSETEYFERVLPDANERPQHRGCEHSPVARNEPDDKRCKRQEMREPQQIEIALSIG